VVVGQRGRQVRAAQEPCSAAAQGLPIVCLRAPGSFAGKARDAAAQAEKLRVLIKTGSMTRLLVSVRDAAEARTAVEAGADLIDVKEPARGPLGAADVEVVERVVAEVAGRLPLSAALGELLAWRPRAAADGSRVGVPALAGDGERGPRGSGLGACYQSPAHSPNSVASPQAPAPSHDPDGGISTRGEMSQPSAAAWPRIPPGLAFVKLGLAGCSEVPNWRTGWERAIGEFSPAVGSVAVVYADWRFAAAPPPETIVAAALENRCRAVLVDTFGKQGGNLLDWLTLAELGRLVAAVRRSGMLAVLGGSLSTATIRAVVALEPDYVAVRGAVCRGGRLGTVDSERVGRLARAVRAIP